MECEGWEAEAMRLTGELEVAQASVGSGNVVEVEELERLKEGLEEEKSKRKRYKELCAKLRAELVNRKLKERWELGVMDAADRERDAREIKLEVEIAQLRMEVGMARLDREEFEVSSLW